MFRGTLVVLLGVLLVLAGAPGTVAVSGSDPAPTVEWRRSYGDGRAEAVVPAANGSGYLVAGHAGGDGWVVRVGPDGRARWSKTLGGSAEDTFLTVVPTGDGYLLGGTNESAAKRGRDAWLVRMRANEEVTWSRTYDAGEPEEYHTNGTTERDRVVAGVRTGAGFVLVGRARVGGPHLHDGSAWALAVGPGGVERWNRTYWLDFNSRFTDITRDAGGGYVVAGWSDEMFPGASAAWLYGLDGRGNATWNRSYGANGPVGGAAGLVRVDDGFALAGTYNHSGDREPWFARTGRRGDLRWSAHYPTAGEFRPAALAAHGDGFVVAGTANETGWLARVSPGGELAWNTTVGESANAVVPVGDDLVVAGTVDNRATLVRFNRSDPDPTPTSTPTPTPTSMNTPTPTRTPTSTPTPTDTAITPQQQTSPTLPPTEGSTSGFGLLPFVVALVALALLSRP